MTAPRPAAAPARATARPAPARPAPEGAARPHLRVVPPPRPKRGSAVVAAALVVVFASLLGTAVLHTMLVSGQRDLDHLDQRIEETRQANRALELRVAELESPARIVAAAERDGMVVPDRVVWVTPTPGGGAESSPAARPGTEGAGSADERAAGDRTAPEGPGADG